MYLLSLVIWQGHADLDLLHVQAVSAICFYQGTPASDQKEPVILQRGRAVTNVKQFCLRCRTVSKIKEQKRSLRNRHCSDGKNYLQKNLNYTVNFVSFFVHWKKLFYEQTHKPVRQSHTKMEQTMVPMGKR